jgi:hypothetical protein
MTPEAAGEDPAAAALTAAYRLLGGLETAPVPAFRAGLPDAPERRPVAPHRIPAVRHLPDALAHTTAATAPLARILAVHAARLPWGRTYTPDDFGAAFHANYGWCELLGTRGPFACDRMALGVLLLGPGRHYPAHRHVAEEIYVPLTGGTEWRAGDADFAQRDAGAAIHHARNVPHAMRTRTHPLLALYLWRGGDLAQRSEIGVRD